MRVSAIIVAGGRGERLGGGTPKQFLSVAGKSLLQRSVDAMLRCPIVDDVIVVMPAAFVATAGEFIQDVARVRVTAGGARRQDSVAAGFDLVDGGRRRGARARRRAPVRDAGGGRASHRRGQPARRGDCRVAGKGYREAWCGRGTTPCESSRPSRVRRSTSRRRRRDSVARCWPRRWRWDARAGKPRTRPRWRKRPAIRSCSSKATRTTSR